MTMLRRVLEDAEESASGRWVMGILFALVGSAIHQFGFALQKLSHLNKNQGLAGMEEEEDRTGSDGKPVVEEAAKQETTPLLASRRKCGPFLSTLSTHSSLEKYHRFAFCIVSAFIGAQSVLLTKIFDLAVLARTKDGSWRSGWTYLTLLLLVTSSLLQVYVMNEGLNIYDATFILPIYLVFWIIGGAYGGASLFNEFDGVDGTDKALFIAGILTVLAGTVVMTFREARLSAKRRPKYWTKNVQLKCCKKTAGPSAQERGAYLTLQWLLGFFLVVFASFADIAALAFAPASVITPFAASSIVFNVVFVVFILNEKFMRNDAIACVALTAGIALCIVGGPKKSPTELSFDQIGDLLSQGSFTVYLIVNAAIIALGTAAIVFCNKKLRRRGSDPLSVQ